VPAALAAKRATTTIPTVLSIGLDIPPMLLARAHEVIE
jgi:hypothetical protein